MKLILFLTLVGLAHGQTLNSGSSVLNDAVNSKAPIVNPTFTGNITIDTTLSADQATPARHATKTTTYTKGGKKCALPSTADGGAETCTGGTGGSMTYPSGDGVAVVSSGASWGTTRPLAGTGVVVSATTGIADPTGTCTNREEYTDTTGLAFWKCVGTAWVRILGVSCPTCAGSIGLGQGTAPPLVANTITEYAPTSVTGYRMVKAGAAATGVVKRTATGMDVVESVGAVATGDTDNTIAKTGVDINTSNQVTATHLASPSR